MKSTMTKKRETTRYKILLCGGCALQKSANLKQDLLNLQMYARLRAKGFALSGGSVWICLFVTNVPEAERIVKAAKSQEDILIMKIETAPNKVISRNLLKDKVVPQKSVLLACGSKWLERLIDKNLENFEILSDLAACEAVDIFYKGKD